MNNHNINTFDKMLYESKVLIKKSKILTDRLSNIVVIESIKSDNRKEIVINDEPLVSDTKSGYNSTIYTKGNCIVGISDNNKKFEDFRFVLIVSNKEEVNKIAEIVKEIRYGNLPKVDKKKIAKLFQKKYGINPFDVYAQGDSKDVNNAFLKRIIPYYTFNREKKESSLLESVTTSMCYDPNIDYLESIKDKSVAGLIIHESLYSSWKCLLKQVNNPEYIIIIKEKKGK